VRNCSCSACHALVRRLIDDDDSPAASSPSRSLSAGSKSPVDSPCRYRQHLGDLRRPARVGRQDLRAELLALARHHIDALVVDARRLDRHGARADRQLALTRPAVAHDQPLAVLVELRGEALDVVGDLRFQRRGDHPPRALSSEVIERDRDLINSPDGEPAYILHGVPSCRSAPASVFSNREGTPPSFFKPVHNIRV